ncbi:FG-GAP-like repeat-containing protein [Aquiflexum balticum]|nr:FG-GAP-like repeat-containing protein [Aquiflexum balticum]
MRFYRSIKSMYNFGVNVFIILFIFSCSEKSKNNKEDFEILEGLRNQSLELSGKELSEMYCGACHLNPPPSLLDKNTWKTSVLPDMRRRMGLITEDDFGVAFGADADAPPGVYATQSYIKQKDWDLIEAYYLDQAPENLPAIPKDPDLDSDNSDLFKISVPENPNKRANLTTLLKWHKKEGLLYLGDRANRLFRFSGSDLKVLDSIKISSPPSDIRFRMGGGFDLLTMGVMDPSNYSLGKYSIFEAFSQEAFVVKKDSLTRPVHFAFADLNQDNEEDVILSNFGHHVGNFSWLENSPTGFQANLINNRPGARKSIVSDINNDGLSDLIVLMTQAKEGVYAYINQDNGKFKEENWLSFHPVFGSSDFDFVDVDADGYRDIVLVNGDNADLSPILKPYHGLRIFLNDGDYSFKESYFYPIHGATALLVEDFDQNGNPDVAVISYFPDTNNQPLQNFLFFRQMDKMTFKTFSFPELGNWSYLTMEKGDINGDGKMDIILGGFDFKTLYAKTPGNWVPFVVLENKIAIE